MSFPSLYEYMFIEKEITMYMYFVTKLHFKSSNGYQVIQYQKIKQTIFYSQFFHMLLLFLSKTIKTQAALVKWGYSVLYLKKGKTLPF